MHLEGVAELNEVLWGVLKLFNDVLGVKGYIFKYCIKLATHYCCSFLTLSSQELMGMAKTPIRLADTQAEPDTRDDFLLAQMLQLEFDREHDSMLTAEEKHYNKHSKGLTALSVLMSG